MNSLLLKEEPVPFIVTNEFKDCPVLITCEHSGGVIPQRFSQLGLDDELFQHLMKLAPQGDNYAGDLSRNLASKFEAPLIESTYHRFIVDVNRGRSERFWFESADGIPLPINRNLSDEDIEQRAQEIWDPFDRKMREMLEMHRLKQTNPLVISIHSYHKTLKRDHEYLPDRPWHIGILWNELTVPKGLTKKNQQLGEFFAQYFEEKDRFVGRNEPYDLRGLNPSTNEPWQTTVHRHFSPLGIPSVVMEIRNDQICTADSRDSWANDLHVAIPQALEILSESD